MGLSRSDGTAHIEAHKVRPFTSAGKALLMSDLSTDLKLNLDANEDLPPSGLNC